MSRALVAAAAALLQLVVGSAPCPRPAGPAAAALAGTAAVHASHGAPGARDTAVRELRAPCPCDCAHAAASSATARLDPALRRAAPAVPLPHASAPLVAAPLRAADVPPATPDPVPRSA